MKFLESIFHYIHGENQKAGRPISYDTTSGNVIISLCLIMISIGFFFWLILFFPNILDSLEDLLRKLFGRKSGKVIGRLLVAALFIFIFPIIRKTVGTQKNYERVLNNYLKMSEAEQETATKKGRNFFGFAVLFFCLPIFIYAIITTFA